MAKALKPLGGPTHSLKARWIAGLHVDRCDFPRVIVHRVPEASMSVLYTSFLNVIEKACRSWLPTFLFLRHDARGVILAKESFGELRVTQGVTDMLKSFVSLSRPVGAAVFEDKLVN